MLDARATQIVTDVTQLLNDKRFIEDLQKESNEFIRLCKVFVEYGSQINPTFEPTSNSDTIARFYMRKAVLKLISQYASDRVEKNWLEENTQKLNSQYTSLRLHGAQISNVMEMDSLIGGGVSGFITSGFTLAGYGNSFPAKLCAAINLFCLAYILALVAMDFLPPERKVEPFTLSSLARNFLFPNSRLDQDTRLLDRLNDRVDALLNDVKKTHVKKLA